MWKWDSLSQIRCMAFFTSTIISDMGSTSGSDALASSTYQKIGRTGSARSDTTEDAVSRTSMEYSLCSPPVVPLHEMSRLKPWEAEMTEKRINRLVVVQWPFFCINTIFELLRSLGDHWALKFDNPKKNIACVSPVWPNNVVSRSKRFNPVTRRSFARSSLDFCPAKMAPHMYSWIFATTNPCPIISSKMAQFFFPLVAWISSRCPRPSSSLP